MFVIITILCLLSFEVLGTIGRDVDVETGIVEPARTFRRTLRDFAKEEAEKKQHELDLKEEADADNTLVGHCSVEPYEILEGGVTESIKLQSFKKSAYQDAFTDPEWKNQWYMHDYRKKNGPVMDLNIIPVHRMGYHGEGIWVAVVDDGVDMQSADLAENLDMDLQFSVAGDKQDGNTKKQFLKKHSPPHGTQMAGIIAMVANNGVCGVGMAYKAKIVAINAKKSIDTGYWKAKGLVHALDKVDIYSNSWGPSDRGDYMTTINDHLKNAIDRGVKEGRGGKGAIYTFAGGNGRQIGDDNCSADDIVNYIHTIGIAGATQFGKRASFSESCAAIFATTYSGDYGSGTVTTTSSIEGWECYEFCTGTSAATPQASAIIALTLQANPQLTYRDVMHLITMSTEVAPLADNDGWEINGAGFWVSLEFGFGLMNAYNMVTWAKDWVNVPPKAEPCEFKFNIPQEATFKTNQPFSVKQFTEGCQDPHLRTLGVKYLEHVILVSNVNHRYRGALSIIVTSPTGTESHVMIPRIRDMSHSGLENWSSKTLRHWGEDPRGSWQIKISSNFIRQGISKVWETLFQTFVKPLMFSWPDYEETGKVKSFTLVFHGTNEKPDHHKQGYVPRFYSAFRTKSGKISEPATVTQFYKDHFQPTSTA